MVKSSNAGGIGKVNLAAPVESQRLCRWMVDDVVWVWSDYSTAD